MLTVATSCGTGIGGSGNGGNGNGRPGRVGSVAPPLAVDVVVVARYINVSMPVKSPLGTYVKLPSALSVKAPCVVVATTVADSLVPGAAVSLARTPGAAISSSVACVAV